MMKESQITYTEGRKRKQKCMGKVLWQELISWSAKRSKKNALILDIAHSKMKKRHLENYLKFL